MVNFVTFEKRKKKAGAEKAVNANEDRKVDLNPNISTITINANGVNISNQRFPNG